MKQKRFLPLMLILPFITSCGPKKGGLVIPAVDVENISVSLPTRPTYNVGDIQTDGTYDYIDIFELSDFHGSTESSDKKIGLPKLSSYMSAKRAENPGGTLLVSAGDMFQGSAESNLTRGFMVNYSMLYMGFDAMAIGNHEFDWTAEWIKNNAELDYNGYKIPYLGANIVEKATDELPSYLKKSTIVERGDYKIGIIGTIGGDLQRSILYAAVKDFEFKVEAPIVAAEASRLKQEGCDLVIWLAHQGLENITEVEGVDAIFGGHAHLNKSLTIGSSTPALATINNGSAIAHMEFKINKITKEIDKSSTVREIDMFTAESIASYAEDQNIINIINQYGSAINKVKDVELGKSKTALDKNQLGNMCVESMLRFAKDAVKNIPEIEEDRIIAAFTNVNGGVRTTFEPGTITYGDVYQAFPFDNEVVLLKTYGQLFKNRINNVTNLAICKNINSFNDIKNDEYYYIVLNDFIALSSDYFKSINYLTSISEDSLIRTGGVLRDELAKDIYDMKNVVGSKYETSVEKFRPFAH